ncbi:MAG: hypothetical protein JRI86_10420 [Deltaproteobacteria bacterium]|nr:hypothetical protein [Deltaproteobacteria bacterium]
MLFRFILIIVLIYIIGRLFRVVFGRRKHRYRGSNGEVVDEMVQDPSCNVYVPRRGSIRRVVHGKELFFCSNECAEKYISDSKDR